MLPIPERSIGVEPVARQRPTHVRYWVVPLQDSSGKLILWIGGTANRNRDAFERTFKQLVEQIQKELKSSTAGAEKAAEALHGTIAGM